MTNRNPKKHQKRKNWLVARNRCLRAGKRRGHDRNRFLGGKAKVKKKGKDGRSRLWLEKEEVNMKEAMACNLES